jgi:hypothetical protein
MKKKQSRHKYKKTAAFIELRYGCVYNSLYNYSNLKNIFIN